MVNPILEFHYKKGNNNVGDMFCNPSRYFNLNASSYCITSSSKHDLKNSNIVIGGGGLIRRYFVKHTNYISQSEYKNLIVWGIGHNFSWKENMWWPKWMIDSTLWGVRDYIAGYEKFYLPCVSCMHDSFDKTYEINYDYGYFLHHHSSKYSPNVNDIYMYNNNIDMYKVINFLASCNTIITDSYHGAYWGLLLGKDVRVVSWTSKFNNFKCQPTIIDKIENWQNYKASKVITTDYLHESRELNKQFYQKFLNLL